MAASWLGESPLKNSQAAMRSQGREATDFYADHGEKMRDRSAFPERFKLPPIRPALAKGDPRVQRPIDQAQYRASVDECDDAISVEAELEALARTTLDIHTIERAVPQ